MSNNAKFRSAVTGEYVTEKFAKQHPREVVKESPPKSPKAPSGKGKSK